MMKIDDVTQPNEVIISIELLHDCLKIMKNILWSHVTQQTCMKSFNQDAH